MAEKSCKRCGQCCDQFPMSESQIERIEKYLEENPDIKNLLRNTPEIIAPPRRVCPFLRGEVGNAYCTIYPVRPEICKVFGVKGYIEGLVCPNGTEITNITLAEVQYLLKIYTEPEGDFYNNVGEYFSGIIFS